jgi:hypothetical protein
MPGWSAITVTHFPTVLVVRPCDSNTTSSDTPVCLKGMSERSTATAAPWEKSTSSLAAATAALTALVTAVADADPGRRGDSMTAWLSTPRGVHGTASDGMLAGPCRDPGAADCSPGTVSSTTAVGRASSAVWLATSRVADGRSTGVGDSGAGECDSGSGVHGRVATRARVPLGPRSGVTGRGVVDTALDSGCDSCDKAARVTAPGSTCRCTMWMLDSASSPSVPTTASGCSSRPAYTARWVRSIA